MFASLLPCKASRLVHIDRVILAWERLCWESTSGLKSFTRLHGSRLGQSSSTTTLPWLSKHHNCSHKEETSTGAASKTNCKENLDENLDEAYLCFFPEIFEMWQGIIHWYAQNVVCKTYSFVSCVSKRITRLIDWLIELFWAVGQVLSHIADCSLEIGLYRVSQENYWKIVTWLLLGQAMACLLICWTRTTPIQTMHVTLTYLGKGWEYIILINI